MKFKKKFILVVLFIGALFLNINGVKAEGITAVRVYELTNTDIVISSLQISDYTFQSGYHYFIKLLTEENKNSEISSISYSDAVADARNSYTITFSYGHSHGEMDLSHLLFGYGNTGVSGLQFVAGDDFRKPLTTASYYLYDKYDYLKIIKCNDTNCSVDSDLIHIQDRQLPNYGSRYVPSFTGSTLTFSTELPLGYSGSATALGTRSYGETFKLNVYIGKISDEDLIESIEDDSASKTEILEYAKSSYNNLSVKSYSYDFNTEDPSINLSNSNFSSCDLYYMYLVNDTLSGKLITVEDIFVVTGSSSGGLTNDISNISEQCGSSSDNTSSSSKTSSSVDDDNPYTSTGNIVSAICFSISILSIIIYFGYRRLKEIKRMTKN